MIPLTIIVDPLGGWLALAFILVFVIKAILAAVGGVADIDLDADGDVDIDADVNTDGFGFSASDFFSLKGFLNFGVGFCSTWALFGLDSWFGAILAVAVGISTMVLLLLAYRACMKLDSSIVLEKPTDLVYRIGTVYSVTNTHVILQISYNGRIDEIVASFDDDTKREDFVVGEPAFISKVETLSESAIRFYAKPYSPDKMPGNMPQGGMSVVE